MKRLLTGIIAATAILFAGAASANNCAHMISNISNLDEATAQELIVQCEQKKLEATKATKAAGNVVNVMTEDGAITSEKLSDWGEIAQEFAKALGIAASEMGIAIDEFLGTTAGKLTAVIIIYKFMGDAILGIVIGLPLLFFAWYVGYRLFLFISVKEYHTKEVKTWRGQKTVSVPIYHSVSDMPSGATSTLWFIGIAEIIITQIILIAVVF